MDLEVTHIRSKDVSRYKHNYEDIYEKSTDGMCIIKGRTTTTQGAYAILVEIVSFLIFLSW